MSIKQKIYAFHLLNDFSGSPKVLMQLVKAWRDNNYEVNLYTNNIDSGGFLSKIENIKYHKGWYLYSKNQWFRLIYYSLSQFILFLKMMFIVKKKDLIYINTVLPFGAALLGKLKGSRVIYHIHESSIKPAPLKWLLISIVKWTASEIIYVSNYVKNCHQINKIPSHVIYNGIENEFLEIAQNIEKKNSFKNVLMVCSLKKYKGVFEYIELAKSCPDYNFRIVFNAKEEEVKTFFANLETSKNLEFFEVQMDLHPFYSWADVILNLSRPDGWIETFGLTIIEGMAYGLPAIVPTIGGIIEVIENEKTAFAIDSRNSAELKRHLDLILSDPFKYNEMSLNSLNRLDLFKENILIEKNLEILDQNSRNKQVL